MLERVVIVHLRRPRLNDPNESRTDPFWEFGSFGLTGCHRRNLLHPKRAAKLSGARLAFAQGGQESMRLVYLSPPVSVTKHKNKVEVRWKPSSPFKFVHAPLIINNSGKTLFPKLKRTFSRVKRDTWVRKFSSRYRTRSTFLDQAVAREMIRRFEASYAKAQNNNGYLAITYEQTMPCLPPIVEKDRLDTYTKLLLKADKFYK